MAYLLIFPIALYIALATMMVQRQPRTITHTVLALYLLCTATVAAAFLILGTTSDRLIADVVSILAGILLTWTYWLFLPLVLIGLYFDSWLRRHWRKRLLTAAVVIVAMDSVFVAAILHSSLPPAIPFESNYWFGWWLAHDDMWLRVGVTLLVSQFAVVAVAGAAVWTGRIDPWRGAAPLIAASVFSVLLAFLSPLTGSNWAVLLTGLSAGLPVLALSQLVNREEPELPIDNLLQSMVDSNSSGAFVVDDNLRVIWSDRQIGRWLDTPLPQAGLVPPPVKEFLRNTTLRDTVQALLESEVDAGEFTFGYAGDEIVLKVERRRLEQQADVPGAQLIILRDITASRIRQDLEERRRDVLALSAISADIASAFHVGEVITRALGQIVGITHMDTGSVLLVDQELPDHLRLAGSVGMSPATLEGNDLLPISDSSAGESVQTRETIVINDGRHQSPHGERMRRVNLLASVTVPLIARDRVIGALQLGSRQPHEFAPITVALIESVGRQLAIAIENARLHAEERRQRHLAETLRQVASLLSTTDLDRALQQMLTLLSRVLTYDTASVLLLAEPGQLSIRAQSGFKNVENGDSFSRVRIEIARLPYLFRLFTERKPQLVSDTTNDTEWVTRAHVRGSWMGVPLIAHDQVLGCLSITHEQPGHFTATDLQVATAFAGQAVIAVENNQLIASEHRRRVQAEILQQTSRELVMSSDLDQAMSVALNDLAKVLPFDRAHIALLEEDGKSWTPRVSMPTPDKLPGQTTLPLADFPLVARLVETRQPILIADTRQNKWWKTARFSPQEVRSWVGMPLIVRDDVIGMLNVDGYEPHRFTQEQFQITQVFANQIAAAIEIFRLIEATSRQNRALATLNTVLSASNEALTDQNLTSVLLERMVETLGVSGGAIHLRDADREQLILQAASGLPASVADALETVPITPTLPAPDLPAAQALTFISVPLVSHGSEIGLLSLCQAADAQLSPTLNSLLPQIGQQLGVVMDNAILFEDALRREALSTNLGRLSLAISAQLDRETVLNLICRESIAVFDAQGAYIWLIENGELVGAAATGPAAEWFSGHRISLDDKDRLPARVLDRWQAQYVNHVRDTGLLDPEFVALTQAQAVIAVPLLKADIPTGTLLLVNTEDPAAFASWQTEQIGILGVQAALAIQNATLFDEIRHRLDQLRLVNEVGRFATAILSPQSLIEGVADKLADILHYDIVGLLLIEDEVLSVHSVFVRDEMLTMADERSLHDPLQRVALQAVRQAEPIMESHTHVAAYRDRRAEPLAYCALATPLLAADEVIGVLVVERRGVSTIVQEDLDVMEPLAAQLAISVANARLFEKVRQQTVELEARVNERTAEIRRQQERTEAILGSVADAVIVFDLDGKVIMMNPMARTLFDEHDLDMDLSARIGTLVSRSLAPEGSGADLTEVVEMGPVALQAKAARVVDGERVLGSVAVLRDISQLKELDRMKDQFVSNVSHELRTPLANLKLYVSLLQQGRPDRHANYLQVMEREVERLARLISDLLDLSRLQGELRAERPQRRQPINLEETINTVVHDNLAWAESKQETLRHVAEQSPLPWIEGDPDQIVRALTNLIGNAISYTPENGRILVQSRAEGPEHGPAEWVIIEVSDTGIGIPESEQPKIFERFYRGTNVNPNTPGTGLGLAIIKEIVELHGGSITVESEEGHGSTFRLRLPAAASPVPDT